jgi:hypothetical protein
VSQHKKIFIAIALIEWQPKMTEVKLHLGVPMVCRSGIAVVLQNLKTKKNLIREVCFGVASYTKGPFTIETS